MRGESGGVFEGAKLPPHRQFNTWAIEAAHLKKGSSFAGCPLKMDRRSPITSHHSRTHSLSRSFTRSHHRSRSPAHPPAWPAPHPPTRPLVYPSTHPPPARPPTRPRAHARASPLCTLCFSVYMRACVGGWVCHGNRIPVVYKLRKKPTSRHFLTHSERPITKQSQHQGTWC